MRESKHVAMHELSSRYGVFLVLFDGVYANKERFLEPNRILFGALYKGDTTENYLIMLLSNAHASIHF